MGNLYFAYGSNLNLEHLHDWCRSHGFTAAELHPKYQACLPDHELVFNYGSSRWDGGVLNLRRRPGQLVEGMVFEADEQTWKALDRKEGAPACYERFEATVLCDGEELQVRTYRVVPDKTSDFVEPSSPYIEVVRKGLYDWKLRDTMLMAAARGERPRHQVDGVFVYGTLMRGEGRFHLLERYGLKCSLLAETPGILLDLGDFPGIVFSRGPERWVQGEFCRIRRIEDAIRILDQCEGFTGFGNAGSLYRRTLILVGVGEGRVRRAWTYVYNGPKDGSPIIECGDWRLFHGKKMPFLEGLCATHAAGNEETIAQRLAARDMFADEHDRLVIASKLLPLARALEQGRFSERRLAQASGKWTVVPV
ncbi:MAG: gamma-glutamylcyclotransferase [Candidatus Hydrogenedentes bacterium]|nr:gamma-glutamylcyclotransferase [Candidatus Hydrogenedentota bacterium]